MSIMKGKIIVGCVFNSILRLPRDVSNVQHDSNPRDRENQLLGDTAPIKTGCVEQFEGNV